ncbi:MAG: ABC transporter ATP-binding protein [Eubacteriales bacterium]|nr:ABC transporter ATP-binding protein [Eubacteriales bacterium]
MALFECKGLTKKYGNTLALNDVNITLEGGRIVGLLGPNGSGKTTLIKIANGLLKPTKGEILIDGKKIGVETKKVVSYLPDRLAFPDWMSADELVRFYKDFFEDFDEVAAVKMLIDLGIDVKKPVKNLSKGTKEKVQLILTMSRRAKLYLLDEPIGGVDPATRDYILKTILGNYNENATIIISTHLISDVESILDEVIFINNGKVELQSGVDELREERGKSVDKIFREVFKCSVD